MTTARDLMTSPAETLTTSDTLAVAAQALRTSNVGSMPVLDEDGRLAGVVTDRDLVVRGIAEGLDVDTATVGEICTGSVVSVTVDDDARAIVGALSENQVRRLPVLDGEDVVGVISQADVARSMSNEQTGDVVQAISRG